MNITTASYRAACDDALRFAALLFTLGWCVMSQQGAIRARKDSAEIVIRLNPKLDASIIASGADAIRACSAIGKARASLATECEVASDE